MEIQDLEELENESVRRGIPIVGSKKGAYILELIKKIKPTMILEFGTANGYSGCILGSEGAHLVTVDINEKITTEALDNFHKHNINAKVFVQDGVEFAKEEVKMGHTYDFIFLDFAKSKYIEVLDSCLQLLEPNGILLADNITFSNCEDFRKAISEHPQLATQFIQIDDGMSVSEKLG